ncbi:MAG: hypothetical protein ACLUTU_14430 [Blautia faecis]
MEQMISCSTTEQMRKLVQITVVWLYETDEYKEWAAKMKEWSDKGFWSKNAVANNTGPRDAFTNGTRCL